MMTIYSIDRFRGNRIPANGWRPTTDSAVVAALALVTALLTISCRTEEISATGLRLTQTETAENSATFQVSLALDFDTEEQEQAALLAGTAPSFRLRVDGAWAYLEDQPFTLTGGSSTEWFPAGPHTFEVVDAAGRTVLHAGPYDVVAGHANTLVVFGPRGAMLHQYLSTDLAVPDGIQRYTIINLARGQSIEAIACTDIASFPVQGCTATSPPLAYGELFSGEAPLPDPTARVSLGASTEGVYYRLSPSAALPVPLANPVPLSLAAWLSGWEAGDWPPIFLGAPIFFDPTYGGRIESLF